MDEQSDASIKDTTNNYTQPEISTPVLSTIQNTSNKLNKLQPQGKHITNIEKHQNINNDNKSMRVNVCLRIRPMIARDYQEGNEICFEPDMQNNKVFF